jgi:endonuclease/exonuclease/phosphatase family metal-dependent hydrolase
MVLTKLQRERGAFRFVSWNVNWLASAEQRRGQLDLIRRLSPDLLAVQEVSAARLKPLEELFSWSAFSIGPHDGPGWTQQQGTALLGESRCEPLAQMLIAPWWFDLPTFKDRPATSIRCARRATWARVRIDGADTPLLVGSLHAQPATSDIAEYKPWFHAGVARWLTETSEPWLFGIDANTPGHDPFEASETRWSWPRTADRPGEDDLLGHNPAHRGSDLLRRWLNAKPERLDHVRAVRPEGPLAVSYRLAQGPVRYDHCWATPEVEVETIDYIDEAFKYSDHAAIVADLKMK